MIFIHCIFCFFIIMIGINQRLFSMERNADKLSLKGFKMKGFSDKFSTLKNSREKRKSLNDINPRQIEEIENALIDFSFLDILATLNPKTPRSYFNDKTKSQNKEARRRSLGEIDDSDDNISALSYFFPERPASCVKELRHELSKFLYLYQFSQMNSPKNSNSQEVKLLPSIELYLNYTQYLFLKCFLNNLEHDKINKYRKFYLYIDFIDWLITYYRKGEKSEEQYLQEILVNEDSKGFTHNGRIFYLFLLNIEDQYIPESDFLLKIIDILAITKSMDRSLNNTEKKAGSNILHKKSISASTPRFMKTSSDIQSLVAIEQTRRNQKIENAQLSPREILKSLAEEIDSISHYYNFERFAKFFRKCYGQGKIDPLFFKELLETKKGIRFVNNLINLNIKNINFDSANKDYQEIIDMFLGQIVINFICQKTKDLYGVRPVVFRENSFATEILNKNFKKAYPPNGVFANLIEKYSHLENEKIVDLLLKKLMCLDTHSRFWANIIYQGALRDGTHQMSKRYALSVVLHFISLRLMIYDVVAQKDQLKFFQKKFGELIDCLISDNVDSIDPTLVYLLENGF